MEGNVLPEAPVAEGRDVLFRAVGAQTEMPVIETILRDFSNIVRRIVSGYEIDPERRRELQQDIHLAIWLALPSCRDRSALRGFITRIARNRSISHVIREAAKPRMTGLCDQHRLEGDPFLDKIEQRHCQMLLYRALDGLPVAMQAPVRLTLEGQTPREIAEMTGLSANIVSIRLTRAKELLRIALRTDMRDG